MVERQFDLGKRRNTPGLGYRRLPGLTVGYRLVTGGSGLIDVAVRADAEKMASHWRGVFENWAWRKYQLVNELQICTQVKNLDVGKFAVNRPR